MFYLIHFVLLLRKNPGSIVELPGNLPERKERRSLTPDQATTLLKASSGDRLHALWATMLMLGLRPGEATALQWDAVDLDNLVLHVRKNLRKVDTVFELSDELKPKRSRRSLDIPPPLAGALRSHRDSQDLERKLATLSAAAHHPGGRGKAPEAEGPGGAGTAR